ncbi:titin-like isoform X2 [Silurus meridionalis]|uniref:titin-like isoform X2 n=1 Tax=Silurus meridionalis TaxID=175797 RepID=UPI001EEA8676|nr:titin-like isoform X2 [Silurus meridionalis]
MSASTSTSLPTLFTVHSSVGDKVTLQCKVSHEIRKGTREIRWFRGTECVYQEDFLKWKYFFRRAVFLKLKDVKVMDSGEYRCEAHGERKEVVAVFSLHVAGFKLVSSSSGYSHYFNGNDATFPCHLSPKKSAVAMEIRWFKGADCICVYQNGQVREGIDYEGRVSLFTHELKEGNLSLMLRNVQESDNGEYKCEITHGKDKVESDQISLCVRARSVADDLEGYSSGPGRRGRHTPS